MFLEATGHGNTHVQQVLSNLKKFLKAPLNRIPSFDAEFNNNWKAIRDESWPNTVDEDTWKLLPQHIVNEVLDTHILPQTFVDSNGVVVTLTNSNRFAESAIIRGDNLRLHRSDPQKAIDVCLSKYCHHFMNGKLYKCGTVALLPEFAKQFNLIVSQDENKLMNSYEPATVFDSDKKFANFIENLSSGAPIPQCQFCTESNDWKKFEASNKKPKIPKISNK